VPTYKLVVEYDGTRYAGWQEQKDVRTVAGDLRQALVTAGCQIVELGAAGRTDAGVHALAQVAHLRLAAPIDPVQLRRDVNEGLPADVNLRALDLVRADFHARHHAEGRSYVYQISRRRTALAKRFVWWVKRPLALRPMREAAAMMVGKHDFELFCERPRAQTSTLVVVDAAEVQEAGALILVRLVASHFLWKMVRRVIGGLVKVGTGEISPKDFGGLLEGRPVRGQGLPAEWTAPPSGLFLESVLYPGDAPLGLLLPPVAVDAD
jgi:tRNA pseudouridine38-40 synthase